MLIRLRKWVGWSVPLLFECHKAARPICVNSNLNVHGQLTSRDRSQAIFTVCLYLLQYFVYVSSKGFGKSAWMPRLVWVLAVCQYVKYLAFMVYTLSFSWRNFHHLGLHWEQSGLEGLSVYQQSLVLLGLVLLPAHHRLSWICLTHQGLYPV